MKDCLTILITTILITTAASAQEVRVLVLDALNGKPQSGAKVYSQCEGALHTSEVDLDVTDATGSAIIEWHCAEDERLILWSIAPPKEQCGDPDSLTVRRIASVGYVARPDGLGMSCPTKIGRRLKPVPGQVILFIKKPTWWQAHFGG